MRGRLYRERVSVVFSELSGQGIRTGNGHCLAGLERGIERWVRDAKRGAIKVRENIRDAANDREDLRISVDGVLDTLCRPR